MPNAKATVPFALRLYEFVQIDLCFLDLDLDLDLDKDRIFLVFFDDPSG